MSDRINLLEQNRLLSQEVKRRIDQMTAINAVASMVSQSLDLDDTLATALKAVHDVVDADASGISLLDEDENVLVLRAQRGWVHDFVVSNPMRIPIGKKGMSDEVINTNKPIVYNNMDGTEEFAVPSFRDEHFRSIAMAPMHSRGEIIGILSIMSYQTNAFGQDMVDVLQVIADTVGVALGNAQLYERAVEQETRVSAIINSTADGIVATDRNSRIRLVNPTAAQMLKVKADALEGMPLREAEIEPTIRDALAAALSSRGLNRTFEVILEDNRVISGTVSPVFIEAQVNQTLKRDGWVVVLQDVTHLREAEIARAQFIQAAAHDMRNPLSLTQSSLEMLDTMITDKDETVIEIMGLAQNGVVRLQSLIDDLLHLEHIESGYNVNKRQINLTDVFYEVTSQMRPVMNQKNISVVQEIEPNLPTIRADLNWIKRALHNYLENAQKYTQDGGEVKLKAYAQGSKVHVEVIDNGPGIPQQMQPRVFERFFRVPTEEKIRGTGLGLAIVKSVAEAHGGKVYLQSEEGKGSTFGMTLAI